MDELREQSYKYLKELDLVFYIMTGAVCLMIALGISGPFSDGMQSGSGPIAAILLPTTVIWIIAGASALIGILAYFIMRQKDYSYISWVLTAAAPRLHEPLPAYLRVPWLWRLKKQGSGKNSKLPLAVSLTVQRYVQTCSAIGIDPGLRSLQITGLVIIILLAILMVAAFVATEAISPDSSRARAIFTWALPMAPFLQLLWLGFAIALQGAFVIMMATTYARINAILDNPDAMEYAMQNMWTGR